MSRFCETDLDFIRTGLSKHGLERSQQPDDEILEYYLDRFRPDKKKLMTFYEFRCLLGAVVESVILIDRLLFLLESDVASQVALIRCFDPVISPRCHALVALT